jgi:DNA-binding NarL/FixJ family response regulator
MWKWVNKKTLKNVGILFIASIVIVFLFRATTFISSLLFEWAIVIALFAGLFFGGRMLLKKMTKGKLETKVLAAKNVDLSVREMEILSRIADGHSNKEIGEQIFISESTVKKHVSGMLVKLDAKRRTEAVKIAREAGLIL